MAAGVLMYPTNAIDVYIYAARSRLLTHYGENPNAVQPVIHWDADPYMHFASREWADNLSPYGPLWNQLAAPITWLGGDSIGAAIIGFKLLGVLSSITIGWLIYDLVKGIRPDWALVAALFWAWNPLVFWDGIGNAHNDVTLMLPVIGSLWAWQRRHDNWVIPLLFASILIKYVTVILLPLAIIALWRRNPRRSERITGVLMGIGWSLVLFAASTFPFADIGSLRESAAEQGAKVNASLAWAVVATLGERSIAVVDPETIRDIAYAIVSVAIAGWMVACWHKPERLPMAMFEVMFLFMLVASTNQRAWYVIWLVPLAAVLIPDSQWKRTLIWCVSSMCGHACTIWLWYVWDFDAWGYYRYIMIIVGVVFLPVIGFSIWERLDLIRRTSGESGRARSFAVVRDQTSPRYALRTISFLHQRLRIVGEHDLAGLHHIAAIGDRQAPSRRSARPASTVVPCR